MVNFTDALETKGAEIERPPLLPVGTYIAQVEKLPAMDKIADGRFDVVDFILRLLSAEEDVDQEALEEYGGLGNARVRHRFLFNTDPEEKANFDRTMWNLKRFISEALGMEDFDKKTMKQALNDCVGMQCMVYIRWRPDKDDPETQYAEVGKTLPID